MQNFLLSCYQMTIGNEGCCKNAESLCCQIKNMLTRRGRERGGGVLPSSSLSFLKCQGSPSLITSPHLLCFQECHCKSFKKCLFWKILDSQLSFFRNLVSDRALLFQNSQCNDISHQYDALKGCMTLAPCIIVPQLFVYTRQIPKFNTKPNTIPYPYHNPNLI